VTPAPKSSSDPTWTWVGELLVVVGDVDEVVVGDVDVVVGWSTTTVWPWSSSPNTATAPATNNTAAAPPLTATSAWRRCRRRRDPAWTASSASSVAAGDTEGCSDRS